MSGLKKTHCGQKCHAETISMADRDKKSVLQWIISHKFSISREQIRCEGCAKWAHIKQISIVIGAVVKYACTSIIAPRWTQFINK